MFRLTCKTSINTIKHFLYSRKKKSLYCEEDKQYLSYPKYEKHTGWVGSKRLYILLGTKCNLCCDYCIQSGKSIIPDFTPNKVDSFIELLTKTINLKEYERIYFWGGEPLVYRKTIKKLIPKLYELKSKNCSIQTATNATLLTEEDIKFFIKYNVRVMISDDGDNSLRFSKEKINYDLIKKFKNKGFNFNVHATITPKNPDIDKIYSNLKQKYGDNVEFGASVVYTPVDNFRKKIFNWDNESLIKLKQGYEKFLSKPVYDHDNRRESLLNWAFNIPIQDYSCRFAEGGGIIVDVMGNIHSCNCIFSSQRILGNLSNFSFGLLPKDNKLQNKRKTIFIAIEDREKCKDCIYQYICRGRCSTISNEAFDKQCKSSKAYWEIAFKQTLKAKFGLTLIKYEKI